MVGGGLCIFATRTRCIPDSVLEPSGKISKTSDDVKAVGMGLWGEFKERCYAFIHANTHPEPFPVDAWSDPAYGEWFDSHRASDSELERQKEVAFSYNPLFSLIVPLYKTPLDFLRVMVDSVLAQSYGRIELILVNASPECDDLGAEVRRYCQLDERVKEVRLVKNYGITENTNCGIAAASGDFLCFLDHDDYLEPDLFFEYVRAINKDPEIDVLYCDEDLVSFENGRFTHMHPLFKPAYSPELLFCKNYIMHLMTIRKSIIDEMPRPDSRYDGAQDYHMLFYATGRARKVHGVQKILYHWRISEGSTAANPHAKPYSRKASRLSVEEGIAKTMPEARIVTSGIANLHNVWFKSDLKKEVSIIVDCEDDAKSMEGFVASFRQTNSYESCELIAVTSDAQGEITRFPELPMKTVAVPGGCSMFERFNRGANAASANHLLFINARSLFLTPEPIEQMLSMCSVEGVGAVAPKTLFFDGSTSCYGIAVTPKRIMPLYRGYPDDFPGYQCNTRAFQNYSAIACQGMLTSKEAFNKAGGFDADYAGEIGAVDYCKRVIDQGYRIVQMPTVKLQVDEYCPDARYDNATNAPEFTESDLARFDAKWPDARQGGDPYLNGNLDQASSYFQIDCH